MNIDLTHLKVVGLEDEAIIFHNGVRLQSFHEVSCCEYHYLSFDELTFSDFDKLEFDLTSDKFFERIPNFGIKLIPIAGQSISIPGYGQNNGEYSENLHLQVIGPQLEVLFDYDITECQKDYK